MACLGKSGCTVLLPLPHTLPVPNLSSPTLCTAVSLLLIFLRNLADVPGAQPAELSTGPCRSRGGSCGSLPSLLQPLVSLPVPCPLELGEAAWRRQEGEESQGAGLEGGLNSGG